MICQACKGTGLERNVHGHMTEACEVCEGSGKISCLEEEQKEEIARLKRELSELKISHDKHLTRRIDLESAIKWWCNDKMKAFTEEQYGKGQMRKMITGKCFNPTTGCDE